jgi:hypothetical protein
MFLFIFTNFLICVLSKLIVLYVKPIKSQVFIYQTALIFGGLLYLVFGIIYVLKLNDLN